MSNHPYPLTNALPANNKALFLPHNHRIDRPPPNPPRSIMLSIPARHLLLRDLNQLMRHRSIVQFQNRLPERIPPEPRQQLDIDPVVGAAGGDAIPGSVFAFPLFASRSLPEHIHVNGANGKGNIHSQADHQVSRVPETNIPACRALGGRIPRRNEQVEIRKDGECNDDVPRAVAGLREVEAFAVVSRQQEADGEEEVEQVGGIHA